MNESSPSEGLAHYPADAEHAPDVKLSGNAERPAGDGRTANADAPSEASVAPNSAYLTLAGIFLSASSLAFLWLRQKRRVLPKVSSMDVALLGLGTARLSRMITREKVMRPLRAPFTITEVRAPGEAEERVKGSGLMRAAGELVTCPRCTAVWAATGLTVAYFAAPNLGRFANLVLSSSLISDFVNRRFAMLNEAPRS